MVVSDEAIHCVPEDSSLTRDRTRDINLVFYSFLLEGEEESRRIRWV